MNCFKCKGKLGDKDICPKCGVDNSMYRKIIYTSNRYYNAGLLKAKVRNLTGAAESLRFCLQMNKEHVQARNLLGLVYYEMGDADLAVKEWSISKSLMPKNNPAEKYMQSLVEDSDKINNYNNAVRIFNQSLESIKTGAEDVAIAKLRKVISINPGFLKAYQVSALLYMKREEYENAEAILNRCLEADQGNIVALTYLSELNRLVKQNKRKKVGIAGKTPDNKKEGLLLSIDFSSYLLSAVYILIGCILSFGICTYMMKPALEEQAKKKQEQTMISYQNTIKDLNVLLAEQEDDIELLEEKMERLQAEIGDFEQIGDSDDGEKTAEIIAAYDTMIDYIQYYLDEDYLKAASEFSNLNGRAVMEGEYYATYKELKEYRHSVLNVKLSEKGTVLFSQQNYEEALPYFLASREIRPDDPYQAFWAAECCRYLGRATQAEELYMVILTKFVYTDYFERSAAHVAAYRGVSHQEVMQQYRDLWEQEQADNEHGH